MRFWEVWGKKAAAALCLGTVAMPLAAGTFPILAPEQFTGQRGEPLVRHRLLYGVGPDISYLLVVENGAGGALDPVASAEIDLNGELVAAPHRFRARVEDFEVPITLRSEDINELVVRLAGRPGSGLRLSVLGVDEKPPEIELLRPEERRLTTTHRPDLLIHWTDDAAQVDPDTALILLDGQDLTPDCRVSSFDADCPTQELADGAHLLRVQVADRAGNVGQASFPFEIDLDREPPRVTLTAPTDGALVRSPTVAVEGTVTDNEELARVSLTDGELTLDGDRFTGRVSLTQGRRTVSVVARDAAGNQGSAEVTVTLDLRAPELTVDPAPAIVHSPTVEISGRLLFAEDLALFTVAGEEVELSPAGFFRAEVAVIPGPNLLAVRVEDLAGNFREELVEVGRVELPRVRITEPPDLSFVPGATVDVRGTLSLPGGAAAETTVTVNGSAAEVTRDPSSGTATFEARGVSVGGERQLLEAVAVSPSGGVASDRVHVVRDIEAPHLVVEYPAAESHLATAPVTLTGRIHDLEPSAGDLGVDVEGQPGQVADGHFRVEGVSLSPGDNLLTVAATDGAGHRREVSVPVVFEPTAGSHLQVVSGGGQTGAIGSELPEPLGVRLVDLAGQPVPATPVLFRVVGGDGSLARLGESESFRQVAVSTDSEGVAQARFVLGHNAGPGAHRLEVSSPGVTGRAVLTATAEPGPPALVVLDGGGIQVGLVGAVLPEPLTVAVTDAGWNRLAGVPVHFAVVKGEGRFDNGEPQQAVVTDEQGRAAVRFQLGPREGVANNVVEASLGDREEGFVTFVASGRALGDGEETSISGRVLDNTDVPVAGVTVTLEGTELTSRTDEEGRFRLDGVPVGTSHMRVDGTTAERPGTWPVLAFEVVPVPGRDNPFPRPIYLLPIDVERGLAVSETEGGVLTLPAVPGLALEIEPGSVTFPDGSANGVLSVTVVHGDKVPMIPSFGAQPRLVLTIQPAGAVLDPPARLTLPNSTGLAPGREIDLVSFDHDVGRFVVFGPGVVSEDGLTISSLPGLGLSKAGWSFEATPSPTGTAHQCSPSCEITDGSLCIPGCPTPIREPSLSASSGRMDLEGQVANLSAPGIQCEECDDTDIGMCETNPHCEDGKCVGEPVTVSEIEGPCVAATAKSVTFTAVSNDPAKVQWTAENGLPPEGTGETYDVRFLMEGEFRVEAGCGSNQQKSKIVTVGPQCASVEPTLLELDTPIPPADPLAFGHFESNVGLTVQPKACVDGDRWCLRLDRYVRVFGISLNAPLGQKDISGPNDPDVTPSTCQRIIEDFTPPPPGSPRGPRRREFWSSKITRAHEEFHARDFSERVDQKAFEALKKLFEQDDFCQMCAGPRSADELKLAALKVLVPLARDFDNSPIDNEIRAHDHSNPMYNSLIADIKARARNAPSTEGWPSECQ